jgi:hypothetical protein
LDRLVSVRVAISRRCERVRVGAASGHSSGYPVSYQDRSRARAPSDAAPRPC